MSEKTTIAKTKLGAFGVVTVAPKIKAVKGGIDVILTVKAIKPEGKSITLLKYIPENAIGKCTDFVKFLTSLKTGQYLYFTYNQNVAGDKTYNVLDQIRDKGFGKKRSVKATEKA